MFQEESRGQGGWMKGTREEEKAGEGIHEGIRQVS
jgi:hypothetical protein